MVWTSVQAGKRPARHVKNFQHGGNFGGCNEGRDVRTEDDGLFMRRAFKRGGSSAGSQFEKRVVTNADPRVVRAFSSFNKLLHSRVRSHRSTLILLLCSVSVSC